jgi:hypothetical protein
MTYDAYFDSLVIEVRNGVRWFKNQRPIIPCYQPGYITTYALILKISKESVPTYNLGSQTI